MLVIGTNSPRDVERLRAGGNRELDWWEEMAANPQLKAAWDQAAFGLRKGESPHAVASTTPRNTTPYREIRGLSGTSLTRASLFDNKHLPKVFVDMMIKKYEGTRLGRQELRGELLDDIEGALWSRQMVEDAANWRLKELELPEMVIIVVAVDPAVTSSEESDDTGIIVAGLGVDGDAYILDDQTCHLSPENWGIRVDRVWRKHRGDYVVGEANNGGDMVEAIILAANPRIPYKKVIASRGKQTRAQPISALYGDGRKRLSRVHHVKPMPELEDQLCTWVPGEEDSPDRLDALVWALTELFYGEFETEQTLEYWEPMEIGADI
jgi:phage terminase large subunit-like protein